jgi:hypothetical protein
VTPWRPLSEVRVLIVTHARFFSVGRGFRASVEFFLVWNPGSIARRPISVSIRRKSRGNAGDLNRGNRVSECGIRNHNDERQLNSADSRRGPVNLVVVSNRVSRGKPNEPMTGGLAAALLPVVENSGAIWVGSSGRVRDGHQKEPFAEVEALGTGALAMLDLPSAHYGGYYEGFANSALWPALHSRSDLIRVTQGDYLSYREVNAFMARALRRFNKPDTAFWVQDYHFLSLGAELRDLGISEPIGFFLHTPWPAAAVIEGVPHHRELVEAMLAYDLIGFQTDADCDNFIDYARTALALPVHDDVAAAEKPQRRTACDRRRPARLFQGPAQPHRRLRPDVEREPAAPARRLVAADRDALARHHRGLWQVAGRCREARHRRQRPPWRGRLDPDPLSQQGFQPAGAGGPLPHRAGRRGDAAA